MMAWRRGSRATVDARDGDDDKDPQHQLEHLHGTEAWAVIARRRVQSGIVVKAGLTGSVLDDKHVHHPESEQQHGRDEEQLLEREVLDNHVADIECKVDAE